MTETAENPDPPKPIVVGVDGSPPSAQALAWAARQARMTGAALVVVAAWGYPTVYGWAPPWPSNYDPEADTRQMCDKLVKEVLGDHPGLDVSVRVIEGHPSPVLTELSREASLVVVGSRGHGEFTGMLIGSVSEFLAAHAHCPVVVLRGHKPAHHSD